MDPAERRRLADNARRQKYFARRRIVAAMTGKDRRAQLANWELSAVWSHLEAQLIYLVQHERDRSSPAAYSAALEAWEAYCELLDRGVQLRLI